MGRLILLLIGVLLLMAGAADADLVKLGNIGGGGGGGPCGILIGSASTTDSPIIAGWTSGNGIVIGGC